MPTIIPERLLLLFVVAAGIVLVLAALARITGRSGRVRPSRVLVIVIVVSLAVVGAILACGLLGSIYLPGGD